MMKGLMIQQQTHVMEENMSNLTSASGEAASFSSSNRNDTTGISFYPQQDQFTPTQNQTSPPQQFKKKRNQPGNPDPEAEVIALSPKSLLATNRFVCEVCNKGFQRDQNLQLHRRGHNLPWKLKKRTNKEVIRKKVYVCPEPSCVHHDPSRALGDLTGIKKHFCRKHGEKKWKCEKCSKRYAVQSDWKAHSKTCGTREYKCECGTIFSRRDSFITHRAFCDALAVESARNNNPINFQSAQATATSSSHLNHHLQFQTTPQSSLFLSRQNIPPFSMKKEQPSSDLFNSRQHDQIPPWLLMTSHHPGDHYNNQEFTQSHQDFNVNQNPNLGGGPHQAHVSANSDQFGLNLSSRDELTMLSSYGNKAAAAATVVPAAVTGGTMMMTTASFSFANNSAAGFEGSTFEDAFCGFANLNNNSEKNKGGNHEDMTKDFLGLRPDSDIFNLAGLVNSTTTSSEYQFQNHKTWET